MRVLKHTIYFVFRYFTVSPDSTTVISSLTTANSSNAFHDSTRLLSKTSGHCFETNAEFQLEDVDTATSSTMVRDLNTRNPPFQIRSYRKVQTFRESMTCLISDQQKVMINFVYMKNIVYIN